MTKDKISKIKEHIEIHTRLEKEYTKLLEQCVNFGAALNTEYVIEEQLKAKLVEAKEIIKNIIRATWGEGWNYSLDWKVKAEQFLSNNK